MPPLAASLRHARWSLCSMCAPKTVWQQWPPSRRASAAAASAAAAAAGGKHAVTYHPDFQISPLDEGHRFPMPKDHLLWLALQTEGLGQAFTPTVPDAETLCLVHDEGYVQSFISGSISQQQMRRIGLPWSQKLVQRTLIGTGSAILAARLALQFGLCCTTNGGTHHAHRAHGSGWCVFNDLAVAARAAQRDAGVGTVLLLDLDVHQGDGSAAIFAGDPSVFTFSVHCSQQSFPTVVPSDWDIGLPAGTGDAEYLRVLHNALPQLLQQVQPELVLYNAGVDVHGEDALGKLALTDAGIAARDRAVFAACLDADAPIACAIGGGYDLQDHGRIVRRHMHLHRAAAEHAPGFAALMEQRRAAARASRLASRAA